MTYQLRTTKDTYFKTSTQDSSTLSASEKVLIKSRKSYPIASFAIDTHSNHLKFTLASVNGEQQTIQGRNTWYVYIPVIQVLNEQGQSVDLTLSAINASGLSLIKSFEGISLTAYDDGTGVLTIGYGHTGSDVYSGETITEQQAETLLTKDLQYFQNGVRESVTVPLTPNQFAALVSFAFNVGLNALAGSTLLQLLNREDYQGAADQFLQWDYAGGKRLEGLTRRREAERSLFLS